EHLPIVGLLLPELWYDGHRGCDGILLPEELERGLQLWVGLGVLLDGDLLHVRVDCLPGSGGACLCAPRVTVDRPSVLELDVKAHQVDGEVVVVRGKPS